MYKIDKSTAPTVEGNWRDPDRLPILSYDPKSP